MSSQRTAFVARFDRIWSQARRVELLQALCWGVLTALAGVALVAAIDYGWELPRPLRVAALAVVALAACGAAAILAARSVRRWRRQATAAAIEQVFPQLGQRIRTTVQYGPLSSPQIEEAGAATMLVSALEDDTVRRAQPLPLDAVIPWRSLAVASLLAAVAGLGLAGASAFDWEWRAAASRAFLGDRPYTHIAVKPGNLTVKVGESAKIDVAVSGRTGKEIVFWSRQTGQAASEWDRAALSPDDGAKTGEQQWQFEIPLSRIRHPLQYKVTAGTATSKTYRVKVLYPLAIVKVRSVLRPPAYTGQGPQIAETGSVTGLVGSKLKLSVELDRAPRAAWLEIREMHRRAGRSRPDGETAKAQRMPLAIRGSRLTASLTLSQDQVYTVVAKAADGMELPENQHRIRVRQDEAPQVWFESPAESLEVHSLAEIIMRARISDDIGLSHAGIMFEVNNEEEYPLLAKDFTAAAKELKANGRISPQTRDNLEKVLPLEHFELTQQDSVLYYAFAEDNRPGARQRTESDLRFIDIRPFRRSYRVLDADDGPPMPPGRELKSLEELISRQRQALNRTLQISRRFALNGQSDLTGVDSLMKFQAELAKSTRELAEGLEARGIDETELLYQAEAAMLGASDSLSAGNYDTAALQQRDALKHLIEGRNRLEIFIQKNPDRRLIAQLRQFDRLQQQKLRRPKSDEEEARKAAERLEELADREEAIANVLASAEGNRTAKGGTGSTSDEAPPQPAENEDGEGKMQDDDSNDGDPGTTGNEPTGNEPTGNEPTGNEPTGNEPTGNEPTGNEPTGNEPTGNEPTGNEPTGNEPTGNEPTGNEPTGSEPTGNEPTGNDPTGNEPAGNESSTNEEGEPASGEPSPQELEDRQLDIALEAREIEAVLARLDGVTDLAKERIAAAAKSAEDAAAALGKQAMPEAKDAATAAGNQFRELSQQVEALLAEEQAERIAAAQEMAQQLARKQQDFADRLANAEPQGGVGDQPRTKPSDSGIGKAEGNERPQDDPMPGVGGMAEEIAEKAQTLADVLGAASKAAEPEDQSSADEVAGIVGSLRLTELAERLQDLPGQVAAGESQMAQTAAGDGAERMEAAAEKLASLHRSIVAPEVDRLSGLEEGLTALDAELDELDTPADITAWHGKASDLLDELDEGGSSDELAQDLLEEMEKAGWGPDLRSRGWSWERPGNHYLPPGPYHLAIAGLVARVRGQIQELMLGELADSHDEPIPPQYQDLVDRYYQVLAGEGKGR